MASILDQYEQAAVRNVPKTRKDQEPIAGGFINASIEDDYPIFNRQKISFAPSDPITHLCVNNSFLVMAMSSNILVRIDLEHPEKRGEIELPKSIDDRIYQLLMDPTGQHIIISMQSSENYYLTRNSKKVRTLTKFKGHQISSVAWNRHNSTETATGKILVGTHKGMIFETEIIVSDEGRFFQSSVEQYASALFKLARDKLCPVTGLHFERMPSANPTEFKYFIIAVLPARLYQFIGVIPASAEAPIFQNIFNSYQNVTDKFIELPSDYPHSDLKFYFPKGFNGSPNYFAWMTGPGIYCGKIDMNESQEKSVLMDCKLIEYPREKDELHQNPKAIVLTEFHVLALFPNRVKAICLLNGQLIYDDVIAEQKFGKLINMCRDSSAKGSIWTFASKVVFKYKIIKEARDVWRMYLDRKDFSKARQYAVDAADTNTVLTKEAEYNYANKKYLESANIYARTQNSFEEITLKFVDLEDKDPLKIFLQQKLATFTTEDKTQHTMIVTWLVEIYLNQLGSLREQGPSALNEYNKLQEKFHQFLSTVRIKECVQANKDTIYNLIASHGDVENMVFFAVFIQDIEKVLTHYIQHENYESALQVLTKQKDMKLFYHFSPILMQNIPKLTVDAWIQCGSLIEPKRLIPALVQSNTKQGTSASYEAIRFLEYCINELGNVDEAIHNYLLALYVKLKPNNLLTYLNMEGQDAYLVHYDLKYALRLCAEHKLNRACVHIYSTMKLYEEAVDLALEIDVDLAKQHADKPENNTELQRKLWLKIARHVVEEKKDIEQAMAFLNECDLLKIEDILPFFPDFFTIDHFKEAICQSLQKYNEHIEGLKKEMDEATESATDIRMEINSFRNKYSIVNSQNRCYSCQFPLMTRGFYLFPCQHCFHKDCLMKEVMPYLSKTKRRKVDSLLSSLSKDSHLTSSASQAALGIGRPEQSTKEKIDDIIASECLYCGDMMIRSIDQPFIDDDVYDEVMRSWL